MIKVSVVIPLYNKEKDVARTLHSILQQTMPDFEVVVVDDGSTDSGANVVRGIKDERIRLICQLNGGEGVARNRGIKEARAELIAFSDADDAWKPDFLETILRLRKKYPQAGICATSYENGLGGRRIQGRRYQTIPNSPWEGILPNYFLSMVLEERSVWSSAVSIPKEVFSVVGWFREGSGLGVDLEMWGRIALTYPVAFSNKICAVYYLDASNRMCRNVYLTNDPPFVKTAQDAIAAGQVKPELLAALNEYIAREKLRVVWSHIVLGNREKAKTFLAECQTVHFRFRKAFLTFLTAFPINIVHWAWKFKKFICK
jgi:glycosyltransferase involved in cell wall biosynthesis